MREENLGIGARVPKSWRGVGKFCKAFIPPRIDLDPMPEAVALVKAIDALPEKRPGQLVEEAGSLAGLTFAYSKASANRIFENPDFKEGLPDVFNLLNGVVVILVLRTFLPRLLALQSMQDVYDFAPELGLPSRDELLNYLQLLGDYDFETKVALFTLVLTIEKMTLIGELIPIGIVLPAISPVLFGGVLEGTVISAACASVSSSVNFVLARTFLRERFLKLEIFGQPPVSEASWFRALSRTTEKDGFKSALLLRLAPLLPVPIDAHWYIAGLTSIKLWEFASAYFVGALKTTFLDAYLGSMLTSAATGTDSLSTTSQGIIAVETVVVIGASVLVSQFATQVFSDMLKEEGFDVKSNATAAL